MVKTTLYIIYRDNEPAALYRSQTEEPPKPELKIRQRIFQLENSILKMQKGKGKRHGGGGE
jgi:hypothetical protein